MAEDRETADEFLARLFEYEYCPECGGDAEDHEVGGVLGNYFAWCKREPATDKDLEQTCKMQSSA